jgi:hypothetical protein
LSSAWHNLSLYESVDLVGKLYQGHHDIELSPNKAREIVSCLAQSREFFSISSESSEIVKPLILYYGVLSLSRALILFLDPDRRETTLNIGHGLALSNAKEVQSADGLHEIANMTVRPQNGTFSELYEVTGNSEIFWMHVQDFSKIPNPFRSAHASDKLQETRWTFREILGHIPDLNNLFQPTFSEPTSCYMARAFVSEDYTLARYFINETVQGHLPDAETFRKSFDLPDTADITFGEETYEPSGYKYRQCMITLRPNSRVDWLKIHPHSVNDTLNSLFVTLPFKDGGYLSYLLLLFAASYTTSMLARYYPSAWTSLISRTKGDYIYPIIKETLSLIQEYYPILALNQLSGEHF